MIVDRRSILRGLFAAPAVVAYANLMPVRAIAASRVHPFLMRGTLEYIRLISEWRASVHRGTCLPLCVFDSLPSLQVERLALQRPHLVSVRGHVGEGFVSRADHLGKIDKL